jgi:transcriptional regulator with XRE-family HTH domain
MSTTDSKVPVDAENRKAGVLALYAKGMTQIEIAARLGVAQSTVSKDLQRLKRYEDKDFMTRLADLQLEFARHTAGTDAALKKMWEFVDDEQAHIKYRIAALTKLMEFYDVKRDEMRFGLDVAIVAKEDEENEALQAVRGESALPPGGRRVPAGLEPSAPQVS